MKKKIISFALALVLSISALIPLLSPIVALAATGSTTEAYFTHEDRETLGMWYKGVDGTYENRDNRVYGKEGLILFYHGQVNDGNALASKGDNFDENYTEFKPMKTAHYIELPDYISKITKVQGVTSMWNNNQYDIEERTYNRKNYDSNDSRLSALLYINYNDPEFYKVGVEAGKGEFLGNRVGNTGWFFDGAGVAQFKFDVTDDNWHNVAIKVGDNYDGNTYFETKVEILDEDGNLISQIVANDTKVTPYLTFRVKGTFQVRVSGSNGYQPGGMQGIFFDAPVKNDSIGVSNLTSVLVGARNVKLDWQNTSNTSYTNIYRRVKGTSSFEYIATVNPGISTYTDVSASVATSYEYTVVPGLKQEFAEDRAWDHYRYLMTGYDGFELTPNLIDYNAIDFNFNTQIETAPYTLTAIEIEGSNLGCMLGGKAVITAKIYKNVVRDAQGKIVSKEPFPGAIVNFSIDGEYVTSLYSGSTLYNMNTNIGQAIADENGVVSLIYKPDYAGVYELTARFEEAPDKNDPMIGYDASSQTKQFVVAAENKNNDAPFLSTVTDAVKPGGAFNITGHFIGSGGVTQVAYAPHTTEESKEFSYAIEGLKLLSSADIYAVDGTYNAALTAVFPKNEACGVYDFWVKNAYGWSKSVTMNIARPLIINQEEGYAGMPIEIAGRNFLGSEFGIEDNTKVKLENVNTGESYIVGINTGVKYTAEECFTGEEVAKSNQFRIEFTVPKEAPAGKYIIYVSNNGDKDFVQLQGIQEFYIRERKAQSWNEDVFGPIEGNTHIGNDPLDIKVAWVQNINYNNVVTVLPQYISADGDYDAWGGDAKLTEFNSYLQSQIDTLSASGGGVLYFPNGYYFMTGVTLKSDVILVGESRENTIIYSCGKSTEAEWNNILIRASDQINIGVARLTFTMQEKVAEKNPSRVTMITESENVFISEFTSDMYRPEIYNIRGDFHRTLGLYDGKNFVLQHIKWVGADSAISASSVTLSNIRDVDIKIAGLSNSFGNMNSFLENTSLVSGNEGHGWSGRNNCYCAYNYIKDIGRKNGLCEGKGEIFYFELAGATDASMRGYILGATERSFTVARTGGEVIDESYSPYYNQIAISIISGRGTGQTRYFNQKPIASKDGVVWGNTYELCSWERDWDVIPDHTSQFSTTEPMANQTVVFNKAEDCAKSLMMYMWSQDSLIYGNNLYRTEGIQVISNELDYRSGFNINYRIENNYIEGISDGTGFGGIALEKQSNNNFAPSLGHLGGVVRGNTIKDLRNYTGLDGNSEFSEYNAGIHVHSYVNSSSLPGNMRNIIIENNTIINCEYGVLIDARVDGVLLKNNKFSEIGINGKNIPVDEVPPKMGRGTEDVTVLGAQNVKAINETIFVVDGVVNNSISGEYGWQEELPMLPGAFLGWSKTETVESTDDIITRSDGTISTLYPIFGAKVSFMLNYDNKGEYTSENVLLGGTVSRIPRPVRKGYSLVGWYTDKEYTTEFTKTTEVTEDVVLYAKWEKKADPFGDNDKDDENNGAFEFNPVLLVVTVLSSWTVLAAVVIVVLIIRKRRITTQSNESL